MCDYNFLMSELFLIVLFLSTMQRIEKYYKLSCSKQHKTANKTLKYNNVSYYLTNYYFV